MKEIGSFADGYLKLLSLRQQKRCDFPSEHHEIAWMFADYFNEPYSFWVRMVQASPLSCGQMRYEFNEIRDKHFKLKDKIKMFTKRIVHGNS